MTVLSILKFLKVMYPKVFLYPTVKPEESNMKLLGHGVMAIAKAKKRMESSILDVYSSCTFYALVILFFQ